MIDLAGACLKPSARRNSMIDRTRFSDLCRLRQSGVVMQHVSAHFENFKENDRFYFFNPLHHACKIFDWYGE
jgi:hypothetical protein